MEAKDAWTLFKLMDVSGDGWLIRWSSNESALHASTFLHLLEFNWFEKNRYLEFLTPWKSSMGHPSVRNVLIRLFRRSRDEPKIWPFSPCCEMLRGCRVSLQDHGHTGVATGNGDLDASEFVDGCMRLKGPARSIDVSLLLQEQRRMRKKITGWTDPLGPGWYP